MNPILVSSDGGKKVNILGIPMVIRVHGSDTGGVVSAVESHDVPGGGPPPHIHHREDETFQVLEGEYEWTVGAKTFVATKGATIFAQTIDSCVCFGMPKSVIDRGIAQAQVPLSQIATTLTKCGRATEEHHD